MIDFTPELLHKFRRMVQSSNKRAKDKNIESRINSDVLIEKYINQQGWCYYCPDKLLTTTMTVEHIVPMSNNGTNSVQNICLCCDDCNKKQNTMIHIVSKVNVRTHTLRLGNIQKQIKRKKEYLLTIQEQMDSILQQEADLLKEADVIKASQHMRLLIERNI